MLNPKVFLLADLLPYEIPLIYTNKDLYLNVKDNSSWDKIDYKKWDIVTEPYNFYITKNDEAKRMISLIHPLSQLHLLKFIEKYDRELIDYCQTHSIFSLRYPSGINSMSQKNVSRIRKELKSMLNEEVELINNEFEEFVDSYFEKKRYVRITDFYKSHSLKRLETKYSVLQKIDFQNCFYNIYTHSIDWAYLGDKYLAKNYRNSSNRFSYQLDVVMRNANFGETNGIVVGPEFSRCVAEIVLTRIDNEVYQRLNQDKLLYKNDYEIARYMDDIFVFCNDEKTAEKIKKIYQEIAMEYKLSVNETKVIREQRPFLRNHLWVPKIKKELNNYFNSIANFVQIKIKSFNYINLNFIDEIRSLIVEYESQKHSIVSYVLAYIERKFSYILSTINKLNDEQDKIFLLSKVIDTIHYVLVFSVTSSNVIKYSKLCLLIKKVAMHFEDEIVIDLLFKKALELLKYHSNRKIELLNLIITFRRLPKDIPEKVLLDLINKDDEQYFTLSTMLYYISTEDRRFRYAKIKKVINEKVLQNAIQIQEDFFIQGTDHKKTQDLVSSKKFLIIHDFYTHPLVSKEVKKEIEKVKLQINSRTWSNNPLFQFFIEYIKDFDKPFMKWDTSDDDMTTYLLRKDVKQDSKVSG